MVRRENNLAHLQNSEKRYKKKKITEIKTKVEK